VEIKKIHSVETLWTHQRSDRIAMKVQTLILEVEICSILETIWATTHLLWNLWTKVRINNLRANLITCMTIYLILLILAMIITNKYKRMSLTLMMTQMKWISNKNLKWMILKWLLILSKLKETATRKRVFTWKTT
jgi:hypothetical protein